MRVHHTNLALRNGWMMKEWWKNDEIVWDRWFEIDDFHFLESSSWLDRGLKPVYEGAPYKSGSDGWMDDGRMMRWFEIDGFPHHLVGWTEVWSQFCVAAIYKFGFNRWMNDGRIMKFTIDGLFLEKILVFAKKSGCQERYLGKINFWT